jgi:hypothetical protein
MIGVFRNVMRQNKVKSRGRMASSSGADILKTLVGISVKKQAAALYAIAPIGLMVRVLEKIVRQEKGEPGRRVASARWADVLKTLVGISVEKQAAALYAIAPIGLIVRVLNSVMREHEAKAESMMTAVPQNGTILGPGDKVRIVQGI